MNIQSEVRKKGIKEEMDSGAAAEQVSLATVENTREKHFVAIPVGDNLIYASLSVTKEAEANAINLKTLRCKIQSAHFMQTHLQNRARDTDRLASLLMQHQGVSNGSVASRYGKRAHFVSAMPAAAFCYNRACAKYDAAEQAAEQGKSSKDVAKIVADGLREAEKSIATVKSTLLAQGEGVPSKPEVVSK